MDIIDRQKLQTLLASADALVLLEALPERYYRAGHLPAALHFPHTEVSARAAELLPDRRVQIVVYCANEACRNSHTAAALLVQLGYTHVAVYGGGKADWVEAGLPLVHPT